ncbi:MAG: SDR family oxidoreductase [Cyclobacteriaceae bacterium]
MKNKVVVITGGSSGIGKACALVFGKAGAKVVISGRNSARLAEAEKELTMQGIDTLTVVADVAKEADNKKLVEQTIKKYGQLDVLINNAGISMRALFNECEPTVIEEVMGINFYGAVYATKYALPHILKTKGSIIGVSSIAGYRGLPARTGYSASKFALQGFLEALRTELLHSGVHVLVSCPGFTESNIRNTALAADGNTQGESPRDEGKMMTSEEVANYILKATRKRKRTLVLTGQGKMTVFLNKFFPAFMDKMVFNHMAKEKDSPLKKA